MLIPSKPLAVYVEYHGMTTRDGLLYGEEYEVIRSIPALADFDPVGHPGSRWTCATYHVRDVFDNSQYVAPQSWFHRLSDRLAGYNR